MSGWGCVVNLWSSHEVWEPLMWKYCFFVITRHKTSEWLGSQVHVVFCFKQRGCSVELTAVGLLSVPLPPLRLCPSFMITAANYTVLGFQSNGSLCCLSHCAASQTQNGFGLWFRRDAFWEGFTEITFNWICLLYCHKIRPKITHQN